MDWSLVLASQGIEVIIEPPTVETGWNLIVPEPQRAVALHAIEKYSAENRAWRWPRQNFGGDFHFDWTSTVWIALLIFCHWMSARSIDFKSSGIFDSNAFKAGEWWRAFTAIMLHADTNHLVSNCILGLVLLGLVMRFYGTGIGLLASFLAGAGGNLIALLADSNPHNSLGASGMVFGALGLLAAQWFVISRKNPVARKIILRGLLASTFLLVLYGLSPDTDIFAHIGGFGTGLLLGGTLAFIPEKWRRNPALNTVCGLLLGGLIIVCWSLALRSGSFS